MRKPKPDILESMQPKLAGVSNLRNTGWPKVIWKASRNYSERQDCGKGGMQEHVGEASLHMVWFYSYLNDVQEMEGDICVSGGRSEG